ncbi:MAG TPA: PilZ domain-containing protein [Thermoanaerobaculia bacterium]|nr:PilZ domain-containing protein [Thermoanaerobaculia bacterium]
MRDEEVTDSRTTPRFVANPPLEGDFGGVTVIIHDLADRGAQIEHADPLKIGNMAKLSVRFVPSSTPLTVRGRVIWSRLSKTPNAKGKYLYRTGLLIEEERELIHQALQQLIGATLRLDENSLERKKRMLLERSRRLAATPKVIPLSAAAARAISGDQILLIRQAREWLRSHPEDAIKWYNRAKFSEARDGEDAVHYNDEMLAIWEYLERTVELALIRHVFEMKA